jgi:hypothetical protein
MVCKSLDVKYNPDVGREGERVCVRERERERERERKGEKEIEIVLVTCAEIVTSVF